MFLLLTLNIAQHEPLNLPFLFIILKSYVPDGQSYNNSNCFTPSPITKHLDLKNFSSVIEAWPLVQFGELHEKIDEKIHEKIEA